MSVKVRVLGLSFLAISMFVYPQEVLSSAGSGLVLWWRFVLPALLPFFILSELLMASGFVHFLGVFLESFMRPVFRLPGQASFVVAMGYTSGFPMGAVLTNRLLKAGELSRIEAERLLAFTNNPSPGFMFGAVASGMLGKPALGIILASSVYLANLLVGILFRFYRPDSLPSQPLKLPSFKRAWQELKKAQLQDQRSFGQLLTDSIKQSLTTVLMVGGFIAFFSMILRLLNIWHLTFFLAAIAHAILRIVPLTVLQAFFNGLLEMTIGCQQTIQAVSYLSQQVGLLAFLMGWGGLSVCAQVFGFVSGANLRVAPFILARILHGTLALVLSQIFLKFAKIPAAGALISPTAGTAFQMWNTWHLSSLMFLTVSGVLAILTITYKFQFKTK